jgi:hypothetical protein
MIGQRMVPGPGAGDLAADLLTHLEAQVASARDLLAVVLEQGSAIRARDVQLVVRLAGIIRGEMSRRQLLEEERAALLQRCGERLDIAPADVTISALQGVMSATEAELAGARSAELRGLLHELQREQAGNRAVLQLELGFLDHLLGMLALDGASGYDPSGSSTPIARARPGGSLHVLDLRA